MSSNISSYTNEGECIFRYKPTYASSFVLLSTDNNLHATTNWSFLFYFANPTNNFTSSWPTVRKLATLADIPTDSGETTSTLWAKLATSAIFDDLVAPTPADSIEAKATTIVAHAQAKADALASRSAGNDIADDLSRSPLDPLGGHSRLDFSRLLSHLQQPNRNSDTRLFDNLSSLVASQTSTSSSPHNDLRYGIDSQVVAAITAGDYVDMTKIKPRHFNAGSLSILPRKDTKLDRMIPSTKAEAISRLSTVIAIMSDQFRSPIQLINLGRYQREYAIICGILTPAGQFAYDTNCRKDWAIRLQALRISDPNAVFPFDISPNITLQLVMVLTIHRLPQHKMVPTCRGCGQPSCPGEVCGFTAPPDTPASTPVPFSSPLSRPAATRAVPPPTCTNFNNQGCARRNCRYTHACSHCGRQGHPATSCFSLHPSSGNRAAPRSPRNRNDFPSADHRQTQRPRTTGPPGGPVTAPNGRDP